MWFGFYISSGYYYFYNLHKVLYISCNCNNTQQAVLTCTFLPFLSFDLLPRLCQKIFPLFVTVRNCTLNLWEGTVDDLGYFLPGLSFIMCRNPSAALPSDYGFFVLH